VTTQQLTSTSSFEKLIWNWQGHKIQYTVMGTGHPLVLIHGFCCDWTLAQNIPVLAAGGYRVFALDLLGFGGSDKPPLDYTLELWNYSGFLDGTHSEPCCICRQFDWRTAEFDGSSRLSTNSYWWRSDQLRRWFESSSPRTQPTLRLVMGTFNRLVRSKLTGQVLFNRVRQKRKFGARSCKSTATRRQLMNWWISCMLPASLEPSRFLPQF